MQAVATKVKPYELEVSDEEINSMADQVIEIYKMHKIDYGGAPKIFRQHFNMKGWMGEYIPFTKENGYRVRVPFAATSENLTDVAEFMNDICRESGTMRDENDLEYLYEKHNKIKVSKIAFKLGLKLKKFNSMANLCANLNLSTVYHMWANEEMQLDDFIHRFQVAYGDYVKGGRNVVVSLNPVDLALLSMNSGYKSCVAVGGCHQSTPLDYLASPHILTCFLEMDSRAGFKIGRRLIFLNADAPAVWFGRIYGTFPDTVSQLMGRTFKDWFPWLKAPDIRRFDGLPGGTVEKDQGVTAYVDHGYGHLYINKNKYEDIFHGRDLTPIFHVVRGKCSGCGVNLYVDAQRMVCAQCEVRACYNCGNKTKELKLYIYEHNKQAGVCIDCLASLPTCESCGHHFHANHLIEVYRKDGDPRSMCFICAESYASYQCDRCDNRYLGEEGASDEENIYCPDCAEGLRYCENCDRLHIAKDFRWDMCSRCAENYFECTICGEVRYEDDCNKGDICGSCFSKLPQCEECECRIVKGHNDSEYERLCFTCADIADRCEGCDTAITSKEKEEQGGLCEACYESKEEEEG